MNARAQTPNSPSICEQSEKATASTANGCATSGSMKSLSFAMSAAAI